MAIEHKCQRGATNTRGWAIEWAYPGRHTFHLNHKPRTEWPEKSILTILNQRSTNIICGSDRKIIIGVIGL